MNTIRDQSVHVAAFLTRVSGPLKSTIQLSVHMALQFTVFKMADCLARLQLAGDAEGGCLNIGVINHIAWHMRFQYYAMHAELCMMLIKHPQNGLSCCVGYVYMCMWRKREEERDLRQCHHHQNGLGCCVCVL